jgi:thiol-disulfide isomerase/thioredoxin
MPAWACSVPAGTIIKPAPPVMPLSTPELWLRAGDSVPAFAARSLEGDTVRIGGETEDATLVNVWATWCIPCREEMPVLEGYHQSMHDRGVRVIGINIDTGGDGPVRAFLEAYDITYLNLRDPSDRVTPAWRLVGVPETLLIGRDGTILHRWIGRFDPSSDGTRALFDDLLNPAR